MFGHQTQTLIAAGTALLALALPGVARASSPCDDPSAPDTWLAFAGFGDEADYFLAPNGSFEHGDRGWTLRNAAVIDGNEDAGVLGGDNSLLVGDSGLLGGLLGSLLSPNTTSRAISPPFCVTAEHPAFRYLLRANGLLGQLATSVRYHDADGELHEQEVPTSTVTTLLPGRWQPSSLQPLATALPIEENGGSLMVQVVFRAPLDLAGGYQIDNLLVDPYRTR